MEKYHHGGNSVDLTSHASDHQKNKSHHKCNCVKAAGILHKKSNEMQELSDSGDREIGIITINQCN